MPAWVQLLIAFAFVLAPLIRQVVIKLNEKAEQNRIQSERSRMRDEMLRTGRSPSEVRERSEREEERRPAGVQAQGGQAARTNLEEIARRRQAQLEELRRRQQAARAQQGAPRPTVQRQGGASTVRPMPGPQRPPTPPQRPTIQQPAPRPQRPVAAPQRPMAAPRPTPQQRGPKVQRPKQVAEPARTPESGLAASLSTLQAFSVVERGRKTQAGGMTLPRDLASWRQAIVMSEILSPPKALRDEF